VNPTIRLTLAALLLVSPAAALAAPNNGPDAQLRKASSDKLREKMDKRTRMMRVVGLAEELDLDLGQAVKLEEAMRRFDEKRKPWRDQVAEAARILERAAEGDTSVQGQVEGAAQKAFEAREKLAAVDREMYAAISKDLSPQKRAQMALFLARFESQSRLKLVRLGNGRGFRYEFHTPELGRSFRMVAPGVDVDVVEGGE
jgi:hypothetical protein